METKIYNYSDYKEWNVKTLYDSENYSDIYDQLIRITAKITEHYASDLIIYFECIILKGVENKEPFDFVFGFRESGIEKYTIDELKEKIHLDSDIIQYWQLIYNPEAETKMELKRLSVYKI